jgi:ABC-type multidrug transport system fused ATPase/permease subunit
MRYGQRFVGRRYMLVRERVGAMLGAMSEAIVGAETVRAFGIAERTSKRIERAIEATRAAQGKAQVLVATTFSAGTLVSNLALAAVVVMGARLGIAGDLTVGRVVAFLFLVQIFTGPVQQATENLNELQNAVAGWRRVLAVIQTHVDVAEAPDAVDSLRGGAQVSFRDVRFAYPGGPEVLHGITLEIPARARTAVVGKTGSGKSTIAKLVTRFMDPVSGAVLLDGMDLRALTASSISQRVVLVPQEGFLFDGSVLTNTAYGLRADHDGKPEDNTRGRIEEAYSALGLGDWLADLPRGLDTPVGQRGESLSAGERQLVAIARAHLAAPDLLVLDEATSAVDPATEVRIARALESLTAGRTTITIAHRLSTAAASDFVVVIDAGQVAEVGTHTALVGAGGVYARMYESWLVQTR